MNLADVVLVFLLMAAAVSGYRQGLVTAILTLVGAVGGALVGTRLAPLAIDRVADSGARIAVGIAFLIVGVGVGELVGQWVGNLISRRFTWRPVRAVDRGLGLVGHTIAVLLVAWLVAVPLAAVPIPWLSSQIRSSAVLSGVNQVMPPSAAQVSGKLRNLFVGADFPQVLAPLSPAPNLPAEAPDPSLRDNPAAAAQRASIVKIRAAAPQCSQGMEGTGFVVADQTLMTNAHVVAGARTTRVETSHGTLDATVVYYDPDVDLAVLHVPGLRAPPLKFAEQPATGGASAVAAGYPLDGPFTLSPMRVRGDISLRGPNIYSSRTVTRDVYTLRGTVRPGNSGGPLLSPDGRVLGVVFGVAIDDPDVAFALTNSEVRSALGSAEGGSAPVSTGACTGK